MDIVITSVTTEACPWTPPEIKPPLVIKRPCKNNRHRRGNMNEFRR
jgi:hypothetical protein